MPDEGLGFVRENSLVDAVDRVIIGETLHAVHVRSKPHARVMPRTGDG